MPYLESKVKNRMYKIQKFYQFKTPKPQTLLSMWHPKLRRRLERAGLDPRQYYCCLWKLNLCSAPKSKKKPQPQRFSIIILFNLCTLADLDFSYRQSFLERQIEQKGKRKQIILINMHALSLCLTPLGTSSVLSSWRSAFYTSNSGYATIEHKRVTQSMYYFIDILLFHAGRDTAKRWGIHIKLFNWM